MLQLTMYQTVILSCPDNCQRKGSKNRTNFSYFPQKPAGSPSLCSSPFRPASHFTCFYFLVVACSHFLLVTCFRSCRTARRFAPAAASLRSGTPLRGYPSHSLRSRAPPAHGAAGGYAVRRLAAIRLSRRETCSDIVTQQDPLYWCRCEKEVATCAIQCKPVTISLPFSSLFAMYLSTCAAMESGFCGKVPEIIFLPLPERPTTCVSKSKVRSALL